MRVPSLPRRAMLRAALGAWTAARSGIPAAHAVAQTVPATPGAGQASEPRSGIELPKGIEVVRGASPASDAPRKG